MIEKENTEDKPEVDEETLNAWLEEQLRQEEEWHEMMNDLYTYNDDGFCDGFTKY